jgi:hypothetical protein
LTRALAVYMTDMEVDTAKHSVEDWASTCPDEKNQGCQKYLKFCAAGLDVRLG